MTSSLVKNSGGGGGYTICMNNRGAQALSRSPERPGSLPTGRDVTRTGNGHGRLETPSPLAQQKLAGKSDRQVRGYSDASPTALLSPATSSVDGKVNPSFSSGSIAGNQTGPARADVGSLGASASRSGSPCMMGMVRVPSGGKTRGGVYQSVSTEEDDASMSKSESGEVGSERGEPQSRSVLSSNAHAEPSAKTSTNLSQPGEAGRDPSSERPNPLENVSYGNPCADDSDDINNGDTNSLNDLCLKEQSCFGLTQSDTSVCSAPNQGREFSGQMEYCPTVNGNEQKLTLFPTEEQLMSSEEGVGDSCPTECPNSITGVSEERENKALSISNAHHPKPEEEPDSNGDCQLQQENLNNTDDHNSPISLDNSETNLLLSLNSAYIDGRNNNPKTEDEIKTNPDSPETSTPADADTGTANLQTADSVKPDTVGPDPANSSPEKVHDRSVDASSSAVECNENNHLLETNELLSGVSTIGCEGGNDKKEIVSETPTYSANGSQNTAGNELKTGTNSKSTWPDSGKSLSVLSENNNKHEKDVIPSPTETTGNSFEDTNFSSSKNTINGGRDGGICDSTTGDGSSNTMGKMRDSRDKDPSCIDVLKDDKIPNEYR